MALTVWSCIGFALAVNRLVFGQKAQFELNTREAWRNVFATLKA
jgi:SSS family solute:Na+ symporter